VGRRRQGKGCQGGGPGPWATGGVPGGASAPRVGAAAPEGRRSSAGRRTRDRVHLARSGAFSRPSTVSSFSPKCGGGVLAGGEQQEPRGSGCALPPAGSAVCWSCAWRARQCSGCVRRPGRGWARSGLRGLGLGSISLARRSGASQARGSLGVVAGGAAPGGCSGGVWHEVASP
jgi:hypothetical protein